MSQDVISQLLAAVLNFTDLNDKFSVACGEVDLVPFLVHMTKELQDSIPHNVKYVVGVCFSKRNDLCMDTHLHVLLLTMNDTSLGTNIVINKYTVSYGRKHFFTQQISSTPFCYDSTKCNYYKTANVS